jgi:hypothetical protein
LPELHILDGSDACADSPIAFDYLSDASTKIPSENWVAIAIMRLKEIIETRIACLAVFGNRAVQ